MSDGIFIRQNEYKTLVPSEDAAWFSLFSYYSYQHHPQTKQLVGYICQSAVLENGTKAYVAYYSDWINSFGVVKPVDEDLQDFINRVVEIFAKGGISVGTEIKIEDTKIINELAPISWMKTKAVVFNFQSPSQMVSAGQMCHKHDVLCRNAPLSYAKLLPFLMNEHMITSGCWYKSKKIIVPAAKDKLSTLEHEYWVNISDLEFVTTDLKLTTPPLILCSFDLEAFGEIGENTKDATTTMSDDNFLNNKLSMICFTIVEIKLGKEKPIQQIVVRDRKFKIDKHEQPQIDYLIIEVDSEEELAWQFFEIVFRVQPDFLLTHNGENFDLPFIFMRVPSDKALIARQYMSTHVFKSQEDSRRVFNAAHKVTCHFSALSEFTIPQRDFVSCEVLDTMYIIAKTRRRPTPFISLQASAELYKIQGKDLITHKFMSQVFAPFYLLGIEKFLDQPPEVVLKTICDLLYTYWGDLKLKGEHITEFGGADLPKVADTIVNSIESWFFKGMIPQTLKKELKEKVVDNIKNRPTSAVVGDLNKHINDLFKACNDGGVDISYNENMHYAKILELVWLDLELFEYALRIFSSVPQRQLTVLIQNKKTTVTTANSWTKNSLAQFKSEVEGFLSFCTFRIQKYCFQDTVIPIKLVLMCCYLDESFKTQLLSGLPFKENYIGRNAPLILSLYNFKARLWGCSYVQNKTKQEKVTLKGGLTFLNTKAINLTTGGMVFVDFNSLYPALNLAGCSPENIFLDSAPTFPGKYIKVSYLKEDSDDFIEVKIKLDDSFIGEIAEMLITERSKARKVYATSTDDLTKNNAEATQLALKRIGVCITGVNGLIGKTQKPMLITSNAVTACGRYLVSAICGKLYDVGLCKTEKDILHVHTDSITFKFPWSKFGLTPPDSVLETANRFIDNNGFKPQLEEIVAEVNGLVDSFVDVRFPKLKLEAPVHSTVYCTPLHYVLCEYEKKNNQIAAKLTLKGGKGRSSVYSTVSKQFIVNVWTTFFLNAPKELEYPLLYLLQAVKTEVHNLINSPLQTFSELKKFNPKKSNKEVRRIVDLHNLYVDLKLSTGIKIYNYTTFHCLKVKHVKEYNLKGEVNRRPDKFKIFIDDYNNLVHEIDYSAYIENATSDVLSILVAAGFNKKQVADKLKGIFVVDESSLEPKTEILREWFNAVSLKFIQLGLYIDWLSFFFTPVSSVKMWITKTSTKVLSTSADAGIISYKTEHPATSKTELMELLKECNNMAIIKLESLKKVVLLLTSTIYVDKNFKPIDEIYAHFVENLEFYKKFDELFIKYLVLRRLST